MLSRLLHPIAFAIVAGYPALLCAGWWMLKHLVPDDLALTVLGRLHLISQVHQRVIDRTLEAGVLLPAVFFFEYLWTGWSDCSIRHLLFHRTASSWSDIACCLLELAPASNLISAAMTFGLVYVSAGWLRQVLARATGLDLSIVAAPLAVQIAILFVVYTLLDYWSHRLDHSRVFWPLHRFHHSAESFFVLTAGRVHPAMFTAVVSATLPGILLGAKRGALAEVSLIIIVIRLVIHSRIASDFGWVGRWIVQSPLHHRLHHSLNRMPVNLGLLPIWDHLFGTWREAPGAPMRIGTVKPYRHGAWVGPDIWRDYCEFWAGLKRPLLRRIGWATSPLTASDRSSPAGLCDGRRRA